VVENSQKRRRSDRKLQDISLQEPACYRSGPGDVVLGHLGRSGTART